MPVNVNVTRLPCVCTTVDSELIIGNECISAPEETDSMFVDEDMAIAYGTSILDTECSNRKIITATGHINGYEDPDTFIHYYGKDGLHPGVVNDCEIKVEKGEENFKVTTMYAFEREDNAN